MLAEADEVHLVVRRSADRERHPRRPAPRRTGLRRSGLARGAPQDASEPRTATRERRAPADRAAARRFVARRRARRGPTEVAFAAVVLLQLRGRERRAWLAPWLVGQIVNEVQAGGGARGHRPLGPARRRRRRGAVRPSATAPATSATGSVNEPRPGLREQLTDRLMRLPARTVERASNRRPDLPRHHRRRAGRLRPARCRPGGAVRARPGRDHRDRRRSCCRRCSVSSALVALARHSRSPCGGICGEPVRRTWPRVRPTLRSPTSWPPPRRAPAPSKRSGCSRRRTRGLRCRHRRRHVQPCCGPCGSARCCSRPSTSPPRSPSVSCSASAACSTSTTISLGTVVAATLYLRQLGSPIDTMLIWVETLQSSLASFARIEGLAIPEPRADHHTTSTRSMSTS